MYFDILKYHGKLGAASVRKHVGMSLENVGLNVVELLLGHFRNVGLCLVFLKMGVRNRSIIIKGLLLFWFTMRRLESINDAVKHDIIFGNHKN